MTMKKVLWSCFALLTLAAAAWVFDNYGGLLMSALNKRRYPDIRRTSGPLERTLDADIRRRKIDSFVSESRRVRGLVEEAEAKGFYAAGLRERLDRAALQAEAGRFREARMLLNIVEVRIPRETESLVPAEGNEPAPPEPKLRVKAVRRSRRGG